MNLPCPAIDLIPHRPPMLLVDSLLSCSPEGESGRVVVTAARVAAVFRCDDGETLDELVLPEMTAQAYACLRGWQDRLAGKKPGPGFLVGIRRFVCYRRPGCHEDLLVEVATTARIEDFYMVSGRVMAEKEILAEGELKLWVPPEEKS